MGSFGDFLKKVDPTYNVYAKVTGKDDGARDIGDWMSMGYKSEMEDKEKEQELLAMTTAQKVKHFQEIEAAKARESGEPWRDAGTEAINVLQKKVSAGPGDFTPGPRYQQRFDSQVADPMSAHAAAGGSYGGGGFKKKMRRASEDFAGQEYDNWLNRYYASLTPLQSLSGMAQTVVGQGADAAQQAADMEATNVLNYGATQSNMLNAQGATQAAQYNALAGGVSTAGSMYDNWAANRQNAAVETQTGLLTNPSWYGGGDGGAAPSNEQAMEDASWND